MLEALARDIGAIVGISPETWWLDGYRLTAGQVVALWWYRYA